MDLNTDTTHVVVHFIKDQKSDQKYSVDLVPRSWLIMERKKWFCKYPPATDYKFINSWVQDPQPPEQWWARVPVRVLKESGTI